MRNLAKALGFLSPGEFRLFTTAELEEARNWICAPKD
jgi:hypothetical protein